MYLQTDLKLPFVTCLETVKKYQEFPLFTLIFYHIFTVRFCI